MAKESALSAGKQPMGGLPRNSVVKEVDIAESFQATEY